MNQLQCEDDLVNPQWLSLLRYAIRKYGKKVRQYSEKYSQVSV